MIPLSTNLRFIWPLTFRVQTDIFRSAHRALVDQVILQLRKLHVTETELLSLKAIMALDPNVKGLSMKSSGHLLGEYRRSHYFTSSRRAANSLCFILVGRESVQNALFSHLMMRHPPSEATARFGHLLLLIASVTVSYSTAVICGVCIGSVLAKLAQVPVPVTLCLNGCRLFSLSTHAATDLFPEKFCKFSFMKPQSDHKLPPAIAWLIVVRLYLRDLVLDLSLAPWVVGLCDCMSEREYGNEQNI